MKTVKDHFHQVEDDAGPVVSVSDPELVARVAALEDAPPGDGAVDSVNGQTGVVVLDAADVGADTAADRDAAIAALVDSSPGALNTLNELAAALGDDENFATTITALIAAKPDLPITQADVTDLVDDLDAKAPLDEFGTLVGAVDDHVASEVAHGLFKVVVDVTPEEMLTLFSDRPEIIPAPAAGMAIIIDRALVELTGVTEPYPASVSLTYGASSEPALTLAVGTLEDDTILAYPGQYTLLVAVAEATAVNLSSAADFADIGPIATSSLGDGGADYEVGDTFTVDGGQPAAEGVVDTIDGGGAVLTYHLTSNGGGYAVETVGITPVVAAGSGLTIDIDSITPQGDGALRVTAWYRIVELVA